MTGYRSRFFRHTCQGQGCYVAQLPSWDDLIECFPRNIRPTDIDGLVEINGHFLFLEEKRAGASPDEGQRRALVELSKRERTTVVFMRPGVVADLDVLVLVGGKGTGWIPYSREEFRTWLVAWAARADMRSAS